MGDCPREKAQERVKMSLFKISHQHFYMTNPFEAEAPAAKRGAYVGVGLRLL